MPATRASHSKRWRSHLGRRQIGVEDLDRDRATFVIDAPVDDGRATVAEPGVQATPRNRRHVVVGIEQHRRRHLGVPRARSLGERERRGASAARLARVGAARQGGPATSAGNRPSAAPARPHASPASSSVAWGASNAARSARPASSLMIRDTEPGTRPTAARAVSRAVRCGPTSMPRSRTASSTERHARVVAIGRVGHATAAAHGGGVDPPRQRPTPPAARPARSARTPRPCVRGRRGRGRSLRPRSAPDGGGDGGGGSAGSPRPVRPDVAARPASGRRRARSTRPRRCGVSTHAVKSSTRYSVAVSAGGAGIPDDDSHRHPGTPGQQGVRGDERFEVPAGVPLGHELLDAPERLAARALGVVDPIELDRRLDPVATAPVTRWCPRPASGRTTR